MKKLLLFVVLIVLRMTVSAQTPAIHLFLVHPLYAMKAFTQLTIYHKG